MQTDSTSVQFRIWRFTQRLILICGNGVGDGQMRGLKALVTNHSPLIMMICARVHSCALSVAMSTVALFLMLNLRTLLLNHCLTIFSVCFCTEIYASKCGYFLHLVTRRICSSAGNCATNSNEATAKSGSLPRFRHVIRHLFCGNCRLTIFPESIWLGPYFRVIFTLLSCCFYLSTSTLLLWEVCQFLFPHFFFSSL